MSCDRVSIVLPVWNAAETLQSAVDSIRNQTWQDWELLLVDDGSTDRTPEIAAQLAATDRRIRLQSRSHEGIVATLRCGCEAAEGAYLARMDADDRAHPERLERQLEFMKRNPKTVLCGTRVVTVGPKVALGRRRYEAWLNALVTHDDIARELFVECPIAHPTFLMRRDAYDAVGGYLDRPWAEDYDLAMRLFEAGGRFANVPEPLLEWRESPDRLSRTDPRYSPEAFRSLKRHYLFRLYLRSEFHQWGAGEVGKAWLREWGERRPVAVVDINPRKIGRSIHGTPVISPEDLPPPGATFTVVAVGAPGARDEIRAWFEPRGYRERVDYLFVA